MEYKGINRRAYKRIKIEGATVTYKEGRFFFSKKQYVEEFYPVVEISRGGVRFLGKKLFTISSKVSIKISLPEESSPLILRGRIRWTSLNPAMSYKYQIGIQFDPFAWKKGCNHPEVLEKIMKLEQKFIANKKSVNH
ncbi:MAG: PilZ domain-containing protein [Candidatus Aminicenantes bacterium]|nr:PilZ domain-containing protein [Candidatus Aminicenantes bacterium]